MRTRAERRHNNLSKARRKRNICRTTYHYDWYDNLHQYSKNKIHCSCPLCATKTNGKKIKHRWQSNFNPTIRDARQLEKLNYGLKEGE